MESSNLRKKPMDGLKARDILVIDPEKDWAFDSEEDLYEFFKGQILTIEKYISSELKVPTLETKTDDDLISVIEDPDEIWINFGMLEEEYPCYTYIRELESGKTQVAICYCYEDEPSFIFSHFQVSGDENLTAIRLDNLIFDRSIKEVFKGAVDGDSLFEGDELAIGLYKAMITLRSETDILEDEFKSYAHLREETIEEPDEIWRSMDSYGHYLVYFIKEFEPESEFEIDDNFYYIVATLEDGVSDSNILLFSFPSTDDGLIERFRKGENLQAEEVTQESSH